MDDIPKGMMEYRKKFKPKYKLLESKNIWNFQDKDYPQEFPKDTDIKDTYQDQITYKIDPNSFRIKTIKWSQGSCVICF